MAAELPDTTTEPGAVVPGSGSAEPRTGAAGAARTVAPDGRRFGPADAGTRCPVCDGPTVAALQAALGMTAHPSCDPPVLIQRMRPYRWRPGMRRPSRGR